MLMADSSARFVHKYILHLKAMNKVWMDYQTKFLKPGIQINPYSPIISKHFYQNIQNIHHIKSNIHDFDQMKCHVFNVIMKDNSNKKSNFWHEIEMEFMVLNVRKELTQTNQLEKPFMLEE